MRATGIVLHYIKTGEGYTGGKKKNVAGRRLGPTSRWKEMD